MTSPFPPRRRDTRSVADRVRQDRENLKRLGVGYVGGRFPLVRPMGSAAAVGDFEDDTSDVDTAELAAINTDRAVCTVAGLITLPLTYMPLDGSLHVRWDGDDLEPSDWSQVGQTITFVDQHIHVGDVLTAAYFFYPSDAPEVVPLALRGATDPVTAPTSIALPAGTEVGDLIVVGNATMHYDGTPGGGAPSDARLTQVGHGAWVGIATTLAPIAFVDPLAGDVDRHVAAIATFVGPATYLNDADAGPGAGGSGTLVAPVVDASSAVLVVTEENPNSPDSPANTVPAGYVMAVNPDGGGPSATVCDVGIWYWTDDTASSSPAGSIAYVCHTSGFAYATTIGVGVSE